MVLTQAINRLEAVLAGEMNALRSGARFNLGETSNRKNQSLLELTRIARGLDTASVSGELRTRLSTLRERLDDNRRLLQLHMEATDEVAGLISRSMAEAESDGTYGSSVRGVTAGG
ncbi:flagellar protein FlgN [Aureimonas mangrovi]|uniref:flagellar protein FlgN n=1 Tax=Aureimonas mangrovi TaxID=2758041 RepID=UPI00163DBA96|nr:flagellar protein FlgN [Aureimonas mangrovi]